MFVDHRDVDRRSVTGTTILAWAPAWLGRPSNRVLAIAALVAANVIWGTTFVATKPALDRIPPLTHATGRFAIALLVLLPLLWLRGRRPTLGRTPALLGFTGIFVLHMCQTVGLEFTSAANGALIAGGVPVLTALLAVPLLGERFGRRRLIGTVLSTGGAAGVVLMGGGATVGMSAVGDGLVLVSALALAGYLVLGRRAFANGDALELVAGVTCYGVLFLAPASGLELATRGMARPTTGDVLSLIYLGVAASAVALLLEAFGLRHLDAGQTAAFANLSPLIGVAAAAVFLAESVTPARLAGGVLIVGGVWLVTREPGHRVEKLPSAAVPVEWPILAFPIPPRGTGGDGEMISASLTVALRANGTS